MQLNPLTAASDCACEIDLKKKRKERKCKLHKTQTFFCLLLFYFPSTYETKAKHSINKCYRDTNVMHFHIPIQKSLYITLSRDTTNNILYDC